MKTHVCVSNKFRINLVFSVSSWTKWVCNSKFNFLYMNGIKYMKGLIFLSCG